ncbi:unnamed protein product [Owenia fusiformis]|uniref:Glutaredoxin domain-containing protein n=1 Tax=Owenia fusiformis TaxID=6347 RepID=A0A8J1XLL7_OWEFU|nr:unnamed protein product [Owenia fusiformis]
MSVRESYTKADNTKSEFREKTWPRLKPIGGRHEHRHQYPRIDEIFQNGKSTSTEDFKVDQNGKPLAVFRITNGLQGSSPELENGHGTKISDTESITSDYEEYEEHFYVSEESFRNAKENLGESKWFVGRRDVSDVKTLDESRIVSSKGTVRGFKNRVRAGIATFLTTPEDKIKTDMVKSEKGKLIFYTTSVMIIRQTYENCKKVKSILHNHLVEYEERDVFMSTENQRELMERLGIEEVQVPFVFADGQLLGGVSELEDMNETGELRKIFKHFNRVSQRTSCERCGGYQWIPCSSCHGSKKSLHRNHFTEEFHALRCIICDENGLVRCDACMEPKDKIEETEDE